MKKQINYWAHFEENSEYHIYNRSINKENIFEAPENCELFLRKLKKLILPYFDIMAYCLMPNHFHLLVSVKPVSDEILKKVKYEGTSKSLQYQEGGISYNDFLVDQFKRLFQAFATIYNRDQNRNGSLFQKRFKRILIKDEFRWKHILAYIHHNPIHHKFRSTYDDWKFSSYLVFLSDSSSLVARDLVLKRFGDSRETAIMAYNQYHKNFKLEKEIEAFYLDSL